jgi:hypothetical protein
VSVSVAGDQQLTCVECKGVACGSETTGWRAYLTIDDEVVIYCPTCGEQEFAADAEASE